MSHERFRAHRHQLTERDLLLLTLEQGDDIMAAQADVLARISTLSGQVADVAAAVTAGFAAASPPVEEQPVLDALEGLSAQVAAIPTHG